jgi:MFS family permease
MSSYSLAVNSYFAKKRGKAIGCSFTITGLGPIVMPQLISFLLSVYTVHDTVLIVAAITAHSFVAACLLQPIKWHMKEVKDEESGEEDLLGTIQFKNLQLKITHSIHSRI